MNKNTCRFPVKVKLEDDECLPGFLLRFMFANAVEPCELAETAGLKKTGWIALCTRPELAVTVAKMTGLTDIQVRRKQITADPMKDDFVIVNGKRVLGGMVDLVTRRRPDKFDGIYRTNWLFSATKHDQNNQPLISVCPCGRQRRWVDEWCCEMRLNWKQERQI